MIKNSANALLQSVENNSIFRLLKKAYKKYLTDKSELHMFRLVIEKK